MSGNVNKDAVISKSVVVFVSDSVSERIFANVIAEVGFEDVLIYQGSIENARIYLKENKSPKVLVLDVSGREMPVRDVAMVSELCEPSVNIIVVGEENDVGVFRKFLSIGVRDYLIKPLNLNLVRETFGSVLLDKTGFRNLNIAKGGKVVGFVSATGGAGATTFATNYAWAMASINEKKTVLVDMNFYSGDTNLILDVTFNDESFVSAMGDVEKIDEFFIQTFVRQLEKKLYYLGYNEQIGNSVEIPQESITKLVNVMQENYNYTVLDLDPNVVDFFMPATQECDYLYIVSELTISSAREAAKLYDFLTKQQGRQNVSVILNKVGIARRGALSKEAFEKVLGKPIYHISSFDPINPVSSLNLGQILVKSRDNDVFKVISSLLEEITNKKQFDVSEESIGSTFDLKMMVNKLKHLFS